MIQSALSATKEAPLSPHASEPIEFSDPAIVLTLGEVHELSSLLGLNIDSAPQLIDRVRQLRQISVEGVNITLEPGLVTRLRSRCLNKGHFAEWLTDEIKRQLHSLVGW